ncbi:MULTISPECIES: FAD-dependent oxidoreductase [Amycolatopsis]|uniref:FAD-dependent oxidoreductase n=2 Tax=Amycolatopsis TaxID=1813 RepID=A0ABW5HT28_9PSEU
MPATYDAIVVGLGIMGSATAAELAGQGNRVLALEARWPLHRCGASADESRILRLSHPDYPCYASDAGAALDAWRDLEATVGTKLFQPTGGLLVSRASSSALSAAAAAAAAADTAHKLLTTAELRMRYPWLRFRQADEGFLDLGAGILLADRCLTAYQQAAVAAGAELRFGAELDLREITRSWLENHEIPVSGTKVNGRHLVLAIGAWLGSAPAPLRWPEVWIERTVSHWFSPGLQVPGIGVENSPFVEWIDDQLELCMIPTINGRVKVKTHHTGQEADPAAGPAPPTAAEEAFVRSSLKELSGLDLPPLGAAASMYTNTADRSLQVRRHPTILDLTTIAACSGHGFKFAPLVAARAAQLCTTVPAQTSQAPTVQQHAL